MKWEELSKPCRNFCFFNVLKVYDPRDGDEKIVFSSFSSAENGVFVLLDPKTLEEEMYSLPYDSGAWAVIQLTGDHSLLFGTCTNDGAAHRFDLRNRAWAGSVKLDEKYIWHFTAGSDGNIYGGTWPGCVLLRYDPVTHELTNIGKTSDNPDNNYSRTVYGQKPGKIYINNGYGAKHVSEYDIATQTFNYHFYDGGQIDSIFDSHIIVKNEDNLFQIVDPDTSLVFDNPVPYEEFIASGNPAAAAYKRRADDDKDPRMGIYDGHLIKMSNGDIFKSLGQEYAVLRKDDAEPKIIKFKSEPPATFIHALIYDQNGLIWGATGLGMTIFNYNTETGAYWNSLPVSTGSGEVYGMVSHNGKIYMTAYSLGEHVVYDPARPWDHRNNINPKTVRRLYPDYIRPLTYSHLDNAGCIWTGWTAGYGTREMAVTRWDTRTDDVTLFEKLIPGQPIFSLDTDGENVWFATGPHANGLPGLDDAFYLCAIDKNGKFLFKHTFEKGIYPGRIKFFGKKGIITAGDALIFIDADHFTLRNADNIEIKSKCVGNISKYDDTTAAIFDAESTVFYDVINEKIKFTAPKLDGCVDAITVGGRFYASSYGALTVLNEA